MFVISCVRKKNQGIGTLTMTGAGFVVWLGFANEDQEASGPFVAEDADARQAGLRAVSAHVGQVWVFGGGSSLSFPPLSFVFEGVSPVLFKL